MGYCLLSISNNLHFNCTAQYVKLVLEEIEALSNLKELKIFFENVLISEQECEPKNEQLHANL
jgi:hypothetical protein